MLNNTLRVNSFHGVIDLLQSTFLNKGIKNLHWIFTPWRQEASLNRVSRDLVKMQWISFSWTYLEINNNRIWEIPWTWWDILLKPASKVYLQNGRTLREKCLNTEFFRSEYRKVRTRKNSVFGDFSHSGNLHILDQ